MPPGFLKWLPQPLNFSGFLKWFLYHCFPRFFEVDPQPLTITQLLRFFEVDPQPLTTTQLLRFFEVAPLPLCLKVF
jgi:hypothetical protein